MNRKKLECFAFVDELTGLPTLAKFRLNAVESVKNSKESDFLLITLDIDNFKYINDVFGYEMGNQLLKCIADHFLKFPFAYRHIGRIFADQFIFLVSATQKEEAISNFHAMLNISEEMQDLFPVAYNLVLSAGIYVLSDPDEAFASCCDKANMARKTVKGRHLTMLREYTTEMDDKMNWKKDITLSMEDALEQGDFQVYLQPKYRFSNECLAGAEALVRWQHTQMGMLLPFSFITLFEQNGFILKLDYYMFEQVCILIRNWIDRGLKVVPISVNLSRLHLANPHLVEELANIAEQYNIPEGMIEIELTESIVLDDSNMLIKIMKKLKEVGFDISVDDFGSGYSSLYLLTDLPVDVLKLDKGFLKKMTEGGNSRLIVEQVVELAKKLHLSIVAEGVETKEQVDFLRCLGCDLAQGYYFAKPMPYQEYEKILEETSTFI